MRNKFKINKSFEIAFKLQMWTGVQYTSLPDPDNVPNKTLPSKLCYKCLQFLGDTSWGLVPCVLFHAGSLTVVTAWDYYNHYHGPNGCEILNGSHRVGIPNEIWEAIEILFPSFSRLSSFSGREIDLWKWFDNFTAQNWIARS